MILEVLLYGLALFWLLGLVPAAAICALRERWLYFLVGWISLGLTWFIGAFTSDPGGPPRDRRWVALSAAAAIAPVLVLGLLGARPAPLLGVSGAALQRSIAGAGARGKLNTCSSEGDGYWRCLREGEEASGDSVPYRVHVNGVGCWHGRLLGKLGREVDPQTITGCIGLADYVFSDWSEGGTD
ncbi:MAG: hypothetical protein ACTHN3_15095 [Solirubrobacterales bacterium]